MLKLMNRNITLEQYVEIVEKAKSAALYDMDSLDMDELHNPGRPMFSVLGVKLRCRDDEDCSWVSAYDCYELFLRFNPTLIKYIREQSRYLLEDDEPGKESARDKLYWEVTKYTNVNSTMNRMYEAYFSLDCELLGVSWAGWKVFGPDNYHHRRKTKTHIILSDAQQFLLDSARQLSDPENVELPYKPGDILYIDARPFGKPFYAVYGTETDESKDYLEWTLREYGYYKRKHICLYISEDYNGLGIAELTDNLLADMFIPHAPLDRIKIVGNCDNPILMKVSGLLKEEPKRFNTWLAFSKDKENSGKSLEQLILGDDCRYTTR